MLHKLLLKVKMLAFYLLVGLVGSAVANTIYIVFGGVSVNQHELPSFISVVVLAFIVTMALLIVATAILSIFLEVISNEVGYSRLSNALYTAAGCLVQWQGTEKGANIRKGVISFLLILAIVLAIKEVAWMFPNKIEGVTWVRTIAWCTATEVFFALCDRAGTKYIPDAWVKPAVKG